MVSLLTQNTGQEKPEKCDKFAAVCALLGRLSPQLAAARLHHLVACAGRLTGLVRSDSAVAARPAAPLCVCVSDWQSRSGSPLPAREGAAPGGLPTGQLGRLSGRPTGRPPAPGGGGPGWLEKRGGPGRTARGQGSVTLLAQRQTRDAVAAANARWTTSELCFAVWDDLGLYGKGARCPSRLELDRFL